MKKHFTLFIVLCLTISLVYCSDDDEKKEPFTYPLTVGNRWNYDYSFSIYNCEPETLNVADTLHSESIVEIVGMETMNDTIELYNFQEEYEQLLGNQSITNAYMNNQDAGLYYYGYKNAGGMGIPLSSHGKRYRFKHLEFGSIQDIQSFMLSLTKGISPDIYSRSDSTIYWEETPLQSLAYPLNIDVQWNFRPSSDPWKMDKKVIGKEKINLSLGDFDCYKIKWLYDIDENGVWDDDIYIYDYISASGLIRRILTTEDIAITDETGEVLGMIDVTQGYELTDIYLE